MKNNWVVLDMKNYFSLLWVFTCSICHIFSQSNGYEFSVLNTEQANNIITVSKNDKFIKSYQIPCDSIKPFKNHINKKYSVFKIEEETIFIVLDYNRYFTEARLFILNSKGKLKKQQLLFYIKGNCSLEYLRVIKKGYQLIFSNRVKDDINTLVCETISSSVQITKRYRSRVYERQGFKLGYIPQTNTHLLIQGGHFDLFDTTKSTLVTFDMDILKDTLGGANCETPNCYDSKSFYHLDHDTLWIINGRDILFDTINVDNYDYRWVQNNYQRGTIIYKYSLTEDTPKLLFNLEVKDLPMYHFDGLDTTANKLIISNYLTGKVVDALNNTLEFQKIVAFKSTSKESLIRFSDFKLPESPIYLKPQQTIQY